MSDELLEKYAGRSLLRADPATEPRDADDLGCFGWLRGVRERAVMLELRKKSGHVLAVGYAWIDRVEFRPEAGITLHCSGRKVEIMGSGLAAEARPHTRLLDGIIRHRVPWVREVDRAGGLGAGASEIVVESIRWEE